MVIVAGTLAGAGDLNVFLVILAAWAGAVIGDNISYGIGKFAGERTVKRLFRHEKAHRGLRLGRAAARGARQLHHPRSPGSSRSGARRSRSRPATRAACPGIASSATTSSPAGSGRRTRRCSATSAASSSRSSRGRACSSGSRSRSRSRSSIEWVGTAGAEARSAARASVRTPRHRRDRVPRLGARCGSLPERPASGSRSRREPPSATLLERLRPDVVIHTAYRQDGEGAREIVVDGSENVARAAVGGRRAARPSLDGRRLRRPQGHARTSRTDLPVARARQYGRAKAEAEARVARVRAGERSLVRTSLIVGGPGHEPSKHELAAPRPGGDVLRRRDPLARSRSATSPRRCSSWRRSTSRGRSTSPAPTTSRAPSSPSSSPGGPVRRAPRAARAPARLLARLVARAVACCARELRGVRTVFG